MDLRLEVLRFGKVSSIGCLECWTTSAPQGATFVPGDCKLHYLERLARRFSGWGFMPILQVTQNGKEA